MDVPKDRPEDSPTDSPQDKQKVQAKALILLAFRHFLIFCVNTSSFADRQM